MTLYTLSDTCLGISGDDNFAGRSGGGQVHVRNNSWASRYNLLFIDNPVGAGFSYTTDPDGYCEDTKECVAADLHAFMLQFYQLFPTLRALPLFLTGESYGGHYGTRLVTHRPESSAPGFRFSGPAAPRVRRLVFR